MDCTPLYQGTFVFFFLPLWITNYNSVQPLKTRYMNSNELSSMCQNKER